MAEILGYDCNGKELRAGDPILLVEVTNPRYEYLRGQQFTLIGPCPVYDDQVEFSALNPVNPEYTWLSGPTRYMKKIPPEDLMEDSQTGRWDKIEETTGYRPEEVESCV